MTEEEKEELDRVQRKHDYVMAACFFGFALFSIICIVIVAVLQG